MATYEKLTLQRFMDSLKAGKYESLTGARRAIGRVDWTEKDKKAAQGLAEKYFGGAAAPAPKKQPAKKVPAAKKSAPVQTTAAPARQPRAKAATTERNFSHVEKLKARSGGVDKLDHTKELIGVVSTALTSLGQVKAAEQTLDITEAQDGINYLTKMIRLLDQQTKTLNLGEVVDPVHEDPAHTEQVQDQAAPVETSGTNGADVPEDLHMRSLWERTRRQVEEESHRA